VTEVLHDPLSEAIRWDGWVIRDDEGMDCHRLTVVSPPHADQETAWLCAAGQQDRRCQVCGESVEFWATFCRRHFAEAMREYQARRRRPGGRRDGAAAAQG
jgi:hypothetical protein